MLLGSLGDSASSNHSDWYPVLVLVLNMTWIVDTRKSNDQEIKRLQIWMHLDEKLWSSQESETLFPVKEVSILECNHHWKTPFTIFAGETSMNKPAVSTEDVSNFGARPSQQGPKSVNTGLSPMALKQTHFFDVDFISHYIHPTM
jgi:hypothetical protein